jgi:lipoate-protein ligase B
MSGSVDHPILVANLGHTSFDACWNLQQEIFGQRLTGRIADVLLLTEHGHVYTLGKNGDEKHLIADRSELAQAGIAVVHIDRGGDITYHGPGQIVGYPILDLSVLLKDLDRYLRAI